MVARMSRQLFSTGSVWEPLLGCSRAVRSGDLLSISACGPLAPDGKTTAAPDAYGQAKRCLEIIAGVIAQAGFSLADVVKTRVYFKDHAHWEDLARAHGEVFKDIRPATAMIQISKLIDPDMVVEIEADAILE